MYVSTQASNLDYSITTISSNTSNTYLDNFHNGEKNIICESNYNKKENIGMNSNNSCDTEEEVRKLHISLAIKKRNNYS